MCAGKVMGPGGEAIKALGERTGCSVVVESKNPNAAFVPFRLVNYLAPGPAEVAAAVAEVAALVCQEEKYEGSIRELTSVCFRIVEIPERRVGALLGPSGAHIKSLQDVLRVKMGVADSSSKPGSRFVRWAQGGVLFALLGRTAAAVSAWPAVAVCYEVMQNRQAQASTSPPPTPPPPSMLTVPSTTPLLQHLGRPPERQGGGGRGHAGHRPPAAAAGRGCRQRALHPAQRTPAQQLCQLESQLESAFSSPLGQRRLLRGLQRPSRCMAQQCHPYVSA